MLKDILLVGAGGFAGSALRYLITAGLLTSDIGTPFPTGTFIVNAAGSLLIGLIFAVIPPGGWQIFLTAGFCGGFTTFSAFSLDSMRLLREGQYWYALFYIAGSVMICLLFVWLGSVIGNRLAHTN